TWPAATPEQMEDLRGPAWVAHVDFSKTLYRLKPFYPLAVYERLEQVRTSAREELHHVRIAVTRPDLHVRCVQLQSEVELAINAACEEIRTRLAALTTTE